MQKKIPKRNNINKNKIREPVKGMNKVLYEPARGSPMVKRKENRPGKIVYVHCVLLYWEKQMDFSKCVSLPIQNQIPDETGIYTHTNTPERERNDLGFSSGFA